MAIATLKANELIDKFLADANTMLALYGVAAFVELKAPGGKPTERQIAIHRFLHRLGFPVCVADSKHKVDCLVREVERRGFKSDY